ncbi:phosphohistidine phosphatase SixA [bacterium]|nr:phosphohistidine phosphatase SixA [bacterium]
MPPPTGRGLPGKTTMLLYFMRHAEAENTPPGRTDADRRLTDRGLGRSREAGVALQALGVEVGLVLTSPLVRAVQTAELVAETLGAPVEQTSVLAGRLTTASLRDLLEEQGHPGTVMLVGHEPDFSTIIGELIGGAEVEMKKGAVACLDCQAVVRGGATLLWLNSGKQLTLMAAGGRAQ